MRKITLQMQASVLSSLHPKSNVCEHERRYNFVVDQWELMIKVSVKL